MLKGKLSGSLLVFLGAVCWSLNAPLVKFVQRDLDPFLVCGLRSLLAGIVLLPFFRPWRMIWNYWTLVYIGSFEVLVTGVILALGQTSSAIAVGMQYTAPVWLLLLAAVKKERICWNSVLPVVLILAGVLFFMSTGFGSTGQGKGNLIALSEGLAFALMTLSAKHASGECPLGLTCLACLFSGLFTFAVLPPSFSELQNLTAQNWFVMLLLGTVQMGAGYGFYNFGLQLVNPRKASVIALWEMILGPLWVALFLKDYPALPVLIGFLIILAGMFLENVLSGPMAYTAHGTEIKTAFKRRFHLK